jgi:hypothetical protein
MRRGITLSELTRIIDAAKNTAFERIQKMLKEFPEELTGDQALAAVKEIRAILMRANTIIDRIKGER